MSLHLIDGNAVSKRIQERLANEIAEFKRGSNVTPSLAVLLIGDDPASAVYVRSKNKAALKLGMNSETIVLPASVSREEVLDRIASLNSNVNTHGILVQLPLPKQLDADEVIDAVSPLKDVDGLHPVNAGMLALGRPRFVPCTPAGIMALLESYNIKTIGRHVVVVGRSNLVGRPISTLLSMKGEFADATVTVCHSRSSDLSTMTRLADILIVAAGKRRMITADMVRPGAVVIDVGIHRLDESEGGGLCGDVDFESVARVAEAITPVPGGVGPMTIAMLMQNTLLAAQLAVRAKNAG
ncbi:bifunctional methylenetetrahydrofolate dehydrogenase/methenyltetrahydrofolate cyclohydrolase FolD [bacterium]|nr:bifunctional methylenetetrahydrofolate dehydrogenase/methenyltetrahydrofolate cyclohydrolase FolD [bacterium]